MNSDQVKKKLLDDSVISVIRMESNIVEDYITNIIEGGISNIEVTMTMKNSLKIIEELNKRKGSSLIGAGTVLDPVSAKLAILSGAKFIVAPAYNKEVHHICNIYDVLYIPGAFTPSEIQKILFNGINLIKLFPASIINPSVVKDLKGPFPQVDFLISGRVNEETIHLWFANKASILCIGSAITSQKIEQVKKVAKHFSILINKEKENI